MMRNFQLIALLLTSFVTPNLVYAVNDHEHDSKTAKHHEHKQNEDEKSRENGAKNNSEDQREQDDRDNDHSDDKHDYSDEHKHK